MYFKDLFEEKGTYDVIKVKIGWLDPIAPYQSGECPKEVVEKLKQLKPVIHTKGWHDCPYCQNATSSKQYLIEVPGRGKNIMYDIPEMIIHYIEEHEYLPPQEFIDTIINLNK